MNGNVTSEYEQIFVVDDSRYLDIFYVVYDANDASHPYKLYWRHGYKNTYIDDLRGAVETTRAASSVVWSDGLYIVLAS